MDDIKILQGWVMGLASAMLVSLWQEGRKKTRTCAGIRTEFAAMRVTCCSIIFAVSRKINKADSEMLRWIKTELVEYTGKDSTGNRLDETLARILEIKDADIDSFADSLNDSDPGGLTIPPINLPFTTDHTSELSLLSTRCQLSIFSAMKYIGIVNDKIKVNDHWEKYTFTGPSEENYRRAMTNSQECMKALVTAAYCASADMKAVCEMLSKTKIFLGRA
jgi:hypothetical protein